METILIAEDDPIFRRVLQSRLQSWGYRVIPVEDGTQAWKLLQQSNTPDLLILDWIMPGVDGIELCRRIRANQKERYQYILLVSGKDDFDIGELRARLRAGTRILTLQHELIQARDALRFQATHDDLTGLWTRGAAMHLLDSELQRSVRLRTPTGILMIDIDHFKSVNDKYGHLNGDIVLREAACRVGRSVRNYDFVGRYGGEEFLVILSNCAPDDLQLIAERARCAFAEAPFPTDAGNLQVTVSVGGAMASSDTRDRELLSLADAALYEAKRTGRNRVVIASGAGRTHLPEPTDSGTQLTKSGV